VWELPDIDPHHGLVRERLERRLQIPATATPEPMFGWYLSIISGGGGVHPHLDATEPGKRHLRCNVFLQLPVMGGMPVIEGRRIWVRPRGFLAFFPSERRHSSERVNGDRQRIILSFGYSVPETYILPPAP